MQFEFTDRRFGAERFGPADLHAERCVEARFGLHCPLLVKLHFTAQRGRPERDEEAAARVRSRNPRDREAQRAFELHRVIGEPLRRREHLNRQHAVGHIVGRATAKLGRLIPPIEHLEELLLFGRPIEPDFARRMTHEGEYGTQVQQRRIRPLACIGFRLHRRTGERRQRREREFEQRLDGAGKAFLRRAMRAEERRGLRAEAREFHPGVEMRPALANVAAGKKIEHRLHDLFGRRLGTEIDALADRTNGFVQRTHVGDDAEPRLQAGVRGIAVRLDAVERRRRERGRTLFDSAAEVVRQGFQCTLLPERVALETLAQPLAEIGEHAREFLKQCFLVRDRHVRTPEP